MTLVSNLLRSPPSTRGMYRVEFLRHLVRAPVIVSPRHHIQFNSINFLCTTIFIIKLWILTSLCLFFFVTETCNFEKRKNDNTEPVKML